MKDPCNITPAEFAIIEVLWQEGAPLSVGDVLERLRSNRPVAYTTVMTLMDKMARKGSLARRKKGKAYRYQPVVRRSDVLNYLVQDFADTYCGGEKRKLTHYLELPRPTALSKGTLSRNRFRAAATKLQSSEGRKVALPAPEEEMDIVLL